MKLKMEQTNYKENKVNQGDKTQTNSVESVSYTHLDVYKRQVYSIYKDGDMVKSEFSSSRKYF